LLSIAVSMTMIHPRRKDWQVKRIALECFSGYAQYCMSALG
jgi:hypothetical protein